MSEPVPTTTERGTFFVDLSGLPAGSELWWLGQLTDLVMVLGLPLIAGALVAALSALWVDRRR